MHSHIKQSDRICIRWLGWVNWGWGRREWSGFFVQKPLFLHTKALPWYGEINTKSIKA